MKQILLCFFLFLLCCGFCTAQQVVSSSGYTINSDVSINWILGGNVTAVTANKPDVSARIQESITASGISMRVYPSPAIDFINIEITPTNSERIILELFNESGIKILNQELVNQPFLQVNISDIPCGIYFLKVFLPDFEQTLKVEKIVKTQTNPL